MPKYAVVAMHMENDLDSINFLFPKIFDEGLIRQIRPMEPFSQELIDYLNALSLSLNKRQNIRMYPDVATFAFFCRKANLLKLQEIHNTGGSLRLGYGLVFHIAPSNVPVNFAYSMVAGFLSGNVNIIRVPSKDFEQVQIILDVISELGNEERFKEIAKRNIYVKYNRSSNATAYFSSFCDKRVIWGGDETINQIRLNKLSPRSTDITFADRYSICVIKADSYLLEKSPEKIAQHFFNDTYLFDQNACTAPHLLIWIGSEEVTNQAKLIFWNYFYEVVKNRYNSEPIISVDKLTTFYRQAAQYPALKKTTTKDNLIFRVHLSELVKNIEDFRGSCGYFNEYSAQSLSEITNIINRKYQTMAYYGFEKKVLQNFMLAYKPFGIDRIVPIGETTNFSLIWDGYGLIDSLTRNIEII